MVGLEAAARAADWVEVATVVATVAKETAVGMEAVARVVAKVAEVRAADLVEVAREEASVVAETEAGIHQKTSRVAPMEHPKQICKNGAPTPW